MKNVFVVGCMFTFSSVLAPIFWYLWIYAGSANANFFYATTLAYNTSQVIQVYFNIILYGKVLALVVK